MVLQASGTYSDIVANTRRELLPHVFTLACRGMRFFSVTCTIRFPLSAISAVKCPFLSGLSSQASACAADRPAVFHRTLFNVSSTNYSTQYQRLRRTDVTISSKSPFILRVTPPKLGDSVTQLRLSSKDWPCLNPLPPIRGIFLGLSRGGLTHGFVPRIL